MGKKSSAQPFASRTPQLLYKRGNWDPKRLSGLFFQYFIRLLFRKILSLDPPYCKVFTFLLKMRAV